MKPVVICLMGPTASGKSSLALELIQRFPMEIISVDSALIYKHMDIGTAKPDSDTLNQFPHHLVNILEPEQSYSAAQFCKDALIKIEEIRAKKKIPLLVGGTMMYFRALQQGMADMPKSDLEVRKKVALEGEKEGWPAMHKKLQEIDPETAARLHPHDSQRIQRALEVYEQSGKTMSYWLSQQHTTLQNYDVINIGLIPKDRAVLHQKIASRFDEMLNQNFIDEVKILFAREGLTPDCPAMRSVGYRQAWEYLEGKYDFTTMREKAIAATRQLAKRQLTWLRSWPELKTFFSEDPQLLKEVCSYVKDGLGL